MLWEVCVSVSADRVHVQGPDTCNYGMAGVEVERCGTETDGWWWAIRATAPTALAAAQQAAMAAAAYLAAVHAA